MQYVTVYDDRGGAHKITLAELLSRVRVPRTGGLSRHGVKRAIREYQCCPPAFTEFVGTSANIVETNVAGDELVVRGCRLQSPISRLDIKSIPGVSVSPSPIPTGFTYDPSTQTLTISLDDNGAAAPASYLLEIHTTCGCCQAISFTQR